MIPAEYHERYIGRLVEGPRTLDELVGDAPNRKREEERLARFIELGYIALENNRYRLNIPVVTAQDEDRLIPAVDKICEALAQEFLDDTLSRFADIVRDLEFDHLMQEPHYVGFMGFIITTTELVCACVEQNLLVPPQKRDSAFGVWAWWEAPKLMRGWSHGR